MTSHGTSQYFTIAKQHERQLHLRTKELVATSCGPAISELLANQSAQTWALLQVRASSIQGYYNIAKTTLEDHGLCYLEVHIWWTCWKEARMTSMKRFTKSTQNDAIFSAHRIAQNFLMKSPVHPLLISIAFKVVMNLQVLHNSYFSHNHIWVVCGIMTSK